MPGNGFSSNAGESLWPHYHSGLSGYPHWYQFYGAPTAPREIASSKSSHSGMARKKSCTKRQLLSLIGYLQYASTVIKPGRTFLRRLIDTSKRQVHLDAPLRLNAEFRGDITWWALFLDKWNGVSIITSLCRVPVDEHLTTDASGLWGCGAFLGSKWFSLSWNSCPAVAGAHISVKELLPITLVLYGQNPCSRSTFGATDNAAVVAMVTSSHPLGMHLLRCLFFICAKHSITLLYT